MITYNVVVVVVLIVLLHCSCSSSDNTAGSSLEVENQQLRDEIARLKQQIESLTGNSTTSTSTTSTTSSSSGTSSSSTSSSFDTMINDIDSMDVKVNKTALAIINIFKKKFDSTFHDQCDAYPFVDKFYRY